jgi:hypothetical protein
MLPTVTIASTRMLSTLDMGLLATVIVIAAIGLMMLTHARHHRHR